MKAKNMGFLATILATSVAANAGLAPNASEVVKLAKSGVSEEVAVAYVRNVPTPFHLSSDDILDLKAQGVSSPVIVAMLTHDAQVRGQAGPYTPPQQVQPPPAYPPAQPAPVYDQPPATAYYPQEVVPASPGPDYYWNPGYWDNGIWIGGTWLYGGVGLGWGWPWGYGWGRYGWGGYGRGYYGGYRGGFGGYRGGFGGGHVGGFGGGHVGGFGGGHGGGHGGGGHR